MSIKLNIPAILRQYANDRQMVEVSGSNVGQCLEGLVNQFPQLREFLFDKEGRLKQFFDVYVNKESSYPEELARPVKDGDELDIVLLFEGG